MIPDKKLERGRGRLGPARGTRIKHTIANRVYELVDSRPRGFGVMEIDETVIEDTDMLVDPSLLWNQRTRGQDVIDPYQASRQASLRNQARWRVITSDLESKA